MWGFAVVGLLAIVGASWLLLSSRSQLLGHFPYRGPTTHKVIALTFDDGPNEPYTSQIADYLRSQGIHATFFQVGQCVERHPLVSRRLSQDGHVIGNHSMTHRFGHYLTQPRYRQELARCQDVIATQIGH